MIYIKNKNSHIQYKYNELTYAETIYNNGFQTNHYFTELKLLAVYYRQVLKIESAEERKKLLEEFCKQHLVGFTMAVGYKLVFSAAEYAENKNNILIDIPMIVIDEKEYCYIMEKLPSQIDYSMRKVLFAFLVNWKLNKEVFERKNGIRYVTRYFKGGKEKYNNIKKLSNIPAKSNIWEILYNLNQHKLIQGLTSGLIGLNFLKECGTCTYDYSQVDITEPDSDNNPIDPAFCIAGDFVNFGYYLDYYSWERGGSQGKYDCIQGYQEVLSRSHKELKRCPVCGSVFKKVNNKHKYCRPQCAKLIKQLQDQAYYLNK